MLYPYRADHGENALFWGMIRRMMPSFGAFLAAPAREGAAERRF